MANESTLLSPNMVTIEITNKCNLNCRYCFETAKNKKTMTFEQLKAACDLIWKKRNKNSTLCISFFGGEPSLEWKNIRKIVDYNNEQGRIIEYNMTTNFTYPFTDDDLEWIANENFGFLVSIDGDKKTHDYNRCNSYNKVKENILKFKDKQILPKVEARMTITPDRAKYLYEDVKSIYDLGISYVCPIPVTDMEWSDKEVKILKKQLRKTTDFVIKLFSKKDGHNFDVKYLNDQLAIPPFKYTENKEPLFTKCGIFQGYNLVIDPDDNVYMCHKLPTTKLSNKIKKMFYYGTLEDFKNDKLFRKDELIKDFIGYKPLDKRNECETCKAFGRCTGPCPIEALQLYDDMRAMNKINCAFNIMCREEGDYFLSKIKKLKHIKSRGLQRILISNELLELVNKLLQTQIEDPSYTVKLNKIKSYMDVYKDLLLPSYTEQVINLFKQMKNSIGEIKECLQQKTQK